MNFLRIYSSKYCRPDRDDSLIANRADGCRSFFKCTNGNPVLTQCSANLRFNERTNYCDWEYNVQCDGQSVGVESNTRYQLPVNLKCLNIRRSNY